MNDKTRVSLCVVPSQPIRCRVVIVMHKWKLIRVKLDWSTTTGQEMSCSFLRWSNSSWEGISWEGSRAFHSCLLLRLIITTASGYNRRMPTAVRDRDSQSKHHLELYIPRRCVSRELYTGRYDVWSRDLVKNQVLLYSFSASKQQRKQLCRTIQPVSSFMLFAWVFVTLNGDH